MRRGSYWQVSWSKHCQIQACILSFQWTVTNLNEPAVKECSHTREIKLHIICTPSITNKFIVNYERLKMIVVLMEGRNFWILNGCTYMYSTEQSVKQKQKIMVIVYEEQRHFLDSLIILCGFLGVVNVYQFNIVVIMQWTIYYETWAFKKKWIMYNKLSVQLYHMYRRWLVSMDS